MLHIQWHIFGYLPGRPALSVWKLVWMAEVHYRMTTSIQGVWNIEPRIFRTYGGTVLLMWIFVSRGAGLCLTTTAFSSFFSAPIKLSFCLAHTACIFCRSMSFSCSVQVITNTWLFMISICWNRPLLLSIWWEHCSGGSKGGRGVVTFKAMLFILAAVLSSVLFFK